MKRGRKSKRSITMSVAMKEYWAKKKNGHNRRVTFAQAFKAWETLERFKRENPQAEEIKI